MPGKRIQIAVIGGGAKAAALAAKAFALRKTNVANIHITVFEKTEIGAHWSGKNGYTDGEQRLCTPAERDLGYPYFSNYHTGFQEGVHKIVYDEFSWSSYLLSESQQFSRWVDGGRKPPEHQQFALYLRWALDRSEAEVLRAEVVGLSPLHAKSKWQVLKLGEEGKSQLASRREFDGIVISGPGPARRVQKGGPSTRMFDGVDFWKRREEFKGVLADVPVGGDAPEIAIIGAGGTAAAVLAWLVRNGYKDYPIHLIAGQAALFTRGDSVFENRLFSEPELWGKLSTDSQDAFFKRLNRGVVWGTVMDQVATATNLNFVDGRVESISLHAGAELQLDIHQNQVPFALLRPAVVIDATGFDEWWFLSLIKGCKNNADFRQELLAKMEPGLRFSRSRWPYPALHAPMVSGRIGPGFGSLMALGGMSDRILRSYL
jgi:mycobactin lysine-N-oxygenase